MAPGLGTISRSGEVVVVRESALVFLRHLLAAVVWIVCSRHCGVGKVEWIRTKEASST